MPDISYVAAQPDSSACGRYPAHQGRFLALPLHICSQWIIGCLFVVVPFSLVNTDIPQRSIENFVMSSAKLFCASLVLSAALAVLRIVENRLSKPLSAACIRTEIAAGVFIGAMLFALGLGMTLVLDAYYLTATKAWEPWLAMIP